MVISSDDEEDEKPPGRLTDLISSSPVASNDTKTTSSARGPSQHSMTPTKNESRTKSTNPHNAAPIYLPKPTRTGKASSKSTSSSPEKSKRKGKADEKGKSGDIFTFFTKQAQRQQAEGSANGSTLRPKHTNSKRQSGRA